MVVASIRAKLPVLRFIFRVSVIQKLQSLKTTWAYHNFRPINKESSRSNGADLAVVVHLFYTDNWPLFVNKLSNLRNYKFDLYITIPDQNRHFVKTILEHYPEANIFIVPNKGRDVLPFMQVARILRQLDYSYLLKFHSKKSTHRDDGQDWLEDMLSKLLPENASVLNDTINALQKPDTGVIGPKGVYYPLTVNFPANGQYMTHVLKRMYRSSIVHKYLQQERAEYGFFGGTMFWARLDSVHDLINLPLSYFEEEKGQIDGTVAHALERLFCIVSEIEGRKMYEVSESSLQQRPYNSANIPQWSEDHLK